MSSSRGGIKLRILSLTDFLENNLHWLTEDLKNNLLQEEQIFLKYFEKHNFHRALMSGPLSLELEIKCEMRGGVSEGGDEGG